MGRNQAKKVNMAETNILLITGKHDRKVTLAKSPDFSVTLNIFSRQAITNELRKMEGGNLLRGHATLNGLIKVNTTELHSKVRQTCLFYI